MKTYWISLYLDISNKDNLKKYGEKAIPVIKSYGGKPIVRGGRLKSFSDTEHCPNCYLRSFQVMMMQSPAMNQLIINLPGLMLKTLPKELCSLLKE